MVVNEKGLLELMKDAFKKKNTGYKVAARIPEDDDEELILSGPGWTAFITRENAPRKVLALIVEHLGDLPREEEAFQVKDKDVQTEIYDVAVPKPAKPVAGAEVRRTSLTYSGYQIWQRTDNCDVFMLSPKLESVMDSYNREVLLTEDGMFYVEGVASRLYLLPLQVKQEDLPALRHLAKMKWV